MGSRESKDNYGKRCEEAAVEYLLLHGYQIRERNWRPEHTHLEVDIICTKGEEMIFVEVKARMDAGADPVAAVDMKKRRNIARAADIYLRLTELPFTYRFDIIGVKGNPDDASCTPEIEHIPDAYLSPLVSR